ncbi:hypothetical protein [Endozoicomonas sp. ONNA2]|uniref:hypothetical protein n=1 Tax=Endozoicomonas sp. ONNA2 TaxID=2828741 RepID=UPI0021495654|nr:hypothetical protein [Endozoicomonas sp. ONNA2]
MDASNNDFRPPAPAQQNEMPNLVKALTCFGVFAGFYVCKLDLERPSEFDYINYGFNGACAAGLLGLSIHYSLLTVVDGVRFVSNVCRGLLGANNPADAPTTPANQSLESNDPDNIGSFSENSGNDIARKDFLRRHSV